MNINQQQAQRYVRRIRNEAKRNYAEAWLAYRMGDAPKPETYDCSILAAQGVRMQIDEIVR